MKFDFVISGLESAIRAGDYVAIDMIQGAYKLAVHEIPDRTPKLRSFDLSELVGYRWRGGTAWARPTS